MDAILRRHSIIKKVTDFFNRLTQERWSVTSPHIVDTLHQEIHQQIEKALADIPTPPGRVVHNPRPLEPITEQQKIVDLAG
jgi:hypothetical protein